jgi:hypothetical protein
LKEAPALHRAVEGYVRKNLEIDKFLVLWNSWRGRLNQWQVLHREAHPRETAHPG